MLIIQQFFEKKYKKKTGKKYKTGNNLSRNLSHSVSRNVSKKLVNKKWGDDVPSEPPYKTDCNWDTNIYAIITCFVQFLFRISPLSGPFPDQCYCAVRRNCSSLKSDEIRTQH